MTGTSDDRLLETAEPLALFSLPDAIRVLELILGEGVAQLHHGSRLL